MVNHGEDVAYYALINKAFHQTCGPNGRIWHQLCQRELGMQPPCCHSLYWKYVHTWDPNMRDRGSVRVVPSHPRIIAATEKGGPFFSRRSFDVGQSFYFEVTVLQTGNTAYSWIGVVCEKAIETDIRLYCDRLGSEWCWCPNGQIGAKWRHHPGSFLQEFLDTKPSVPYEGVRFGPLAVSYGTGDRIGVFVDGRNNNLTFFKNGESTGRGFTSCHFDKKIYPAIYTFHGDRYRLRTCGGTRKLLDMRQKSELALYPVTDFETQYEQDRRNYERNLDLNYNTIPPGM